jgi:hypothetical protein
VRGEDADDKDEDDESKEDDDSFESSEDAIDEAISSAKKSDKEGPSTANPPGRHGTDASEITRDQRGRDRTNSSDAQRTSVDSTAAGDAPSAGAPHGASSSYDSHDIGVGARGSASTSPPLGKIAVCSE